MTLAPALLFLALLVAPVTALAVAPGISPPPPPDLPVPGALVARDRPGDGGGSILLTWTDPPVLPEGAVLEIRRAEPPAYEWSVVGTAAPGVGRHVDATAKNGTVYRYEVRVRGAAAAPPATSAADTLAAAGADTPAGNTDTLAVAPVGPGSVSDPVASHDNWFRGERTNSFLATILFTAIILGSIGWARSGRELYIRRIAGLNAVDEAIGRATELGRKVLYVPGIQSVSDIQTIASLAILGHVARASARYGTDLDCPNRDPLTFVSARETVRAAFLAEGRPDLYREEMVNYITYDQFAYTAAVGGRMVRDRPAANFLIGHFFAESLIMAETGQSTGAIQIAGTADPAQLPFFVAACDYTLIGEELYAAGAYLSREPILMGSIRGQDIAKALLLLFGLAGIVAAQFGQTWFANVLKTQ